MPSRTALLTLRVYALYDRNRYILWTLLVLIVSTTVASSVSVLLLVMAYACGLCRVLTRSVRDQFIIASQVHGISITTKFDNRQYVNRFLTLFA